MTTHPAARRSPSALARAAEVAREAGAQLRDAFARVGELRIATKSTPTDLVSEADVAAERLIRERLAAARARTTRCWGRRAATAPGTSGLRWVVDPLDGTVNFLFGIPQWCVSIACEDADGRRRRRRLRPDARRAVGGDARRRRRRSNGEPAARRRARRSSRTALVATGFGYDAGVRARRRREVIAPAAAARARHAPPRLGRARSRLDGRRPLRRLLRARRQPLGPRRRRADLRARRASPCARSRPRRRAGRACSSPPRRSRRRCGRCWIEPDPSARGPDADAAGARRLCWAARGGGGTGLRAGFKSR